MAESESVSASQKRPDEVVPPIPPAADPQQQPHQPSPSLVSILSSSKRPSLRVTSEFDSETSILFHKLSCRLLNSLAKLKFSFQNNNKGEVLEPHFSLSSKFLSLHYDLEDQNALLKTSFDVGPRLHFDVAHDLKAQGEVAMVAKLADPGYALELSSPVPTIGRPRATLKFPIGEISLEEKEEEEVKRALSISGVVKGRLSNGSCSAQFSDEELKLRYCYKDEAIAFIPSISLPSNALSFAFKRWINPSNKLSYWYNFDSNNWSAVYKHTYGKDFKLKAGYDSEVRLGWASLWVSLKCHSILLPYVFRIQLLILFSASSALSFLLQ
uniref:Uncharacterized protein n=1 Tax=Rhizophora mucronata TaxID=61149 RepID=A0A2P2LE77_RHIMU